MTDIKDDLLSGLEVVTERSHSLENFIDRYQQLYRLPAPEKTLFDVKELLVLLISLYEEVNISLNERPHLVLFADKTQMQQVLVNLIKNAIESLIDTSEPDISLDYMAENSHVIIEVKDNGMGIYNSENLFVPYYRTKSQGCGIGLALSRQIIANHGGELSLNNRQDRRGAIARIYMLVFVND